MKNGCNRQLEQKEFILKTCTLVDATWLQVARRAPAKEDKTGGEEDAGYTVKKGRPHYGYKAQVSADQQHTMIRRVALTDASVHESREFESGVSGDEEIVMADKADGSAARSRWCARRKIGNGILRKAVRGQPLDRTTVWFNRLMSRVRCGIEKIFGWWQRCAGYGRVRYVGREPNRLELEFKSICGNLKRLVSLTRT